MKRSEILLGILRVPLDAVAVAGAVVVAYILRQENIDLIPRVQLLQAAETLPAPDYYLTYFALPSVVLFLLLAIFFRLYSLRVNHSGWYEIGRIIATSLVWFVTIMAWYFLVQRQLFFSRVLLLHSLFFTVFFVSCERAGILLFQKSLLARGIGVRKVVSFGRKRMVAHAKEILQRERAYEYLGHCSNFRSLKHFDEKHSIDLVFQTDANPASAQTIRLIDYCRSSHIGYAFLPPVLADVPHLLRIDYLGLLPLMWLQPTPLDGWGRVWKRFFDIVGAALLLILLSPIFLVVSILLLLEDGWPIFYASIRVGEYGKKEFPVYKFRTMVKNADEWKKRLLKYNARKDGPLFKMKNDPRITKIGRFLRRFDIDELPQLFNVLIGTMSLVGPRPHLPEEVKRYKQEQRRVFAIKPGLTGLAQVSGRSNLSFDDEVRLDLQYIEEWSPLFDIWILWRTVFTVLLEKPE